jgi:hypothetical protein
MIKKIKELEPRRGILSDIPERAAYYILHSYFITDQIYTRRQEVAVEEGKDKKYEYLAVEYKLTCTTDKMFNMINTLSDIDPKCLAKKNSKVSVGSVSSVPPEFKMNPDFLKQLESEGPKVICVSRDTHAVIMFHVFPDQKLSSIARGIGQYESKIKKLSFNTKRNHLEWAFGALVEAIRIVEQKGTK